MKKDTEEAVALLRRLIATPSVSREEKEAADIIEDYLKTKGFTPHRHQHNVWAVAPDYDERRSTILLNAHIDTVRPVSGWQHDPFTPTQEGDRLFGLGSNDCGGGLVSLLQVFINLSATGQTAANLVFLASAEEEVSGKNGIECVLPLLPKIDVAIVGEPTGMQPAVAEKGLMVIDAVAHGKAGHAARNEGVNAIYLAMDDIKTIESTKEQEQSTNMFPKISPLLGPVKATVTIIEAGTQHNVVPDSCRFTIDVRSTECYTNEEIFDILQHHLKSELKARSFRLSSSSIPMDHPLVKRCMEMGMQPFGSPTLSDQALMRFPSLKLGPGDSARSHTADEFICLAEIEQAIGIYTELLKEIQ